MSIEIDAIAEIDSLTPAVPFNRRGFLVTSLGAGFALAVQPALGQGAISTPADGLVAGESVTMSAPSGEVTVADGFKATCTGWKLYDAAGSVVDSGSGTSFTYVHPTPAAYRRLEWQFSTAIRVTASGAGGRISPPSSGWLSVLRHPSWFPLTKENASMW